MRRLRISLVIALLALSSLVTTAAPAQASCSGKFTETCQKLENLVCYVFEKCL
jgi:hypothetical protein